MPPDEADEARPRHARRRPRWPWVVVPVLVATAVGLVAVVVLTTRSAPRPAPWSDQRLADALTVEFVSQGATITPAEVAGILAQDCPYVDDPAGLVRHQQPSLDTGGADFSGTVAAVASTMSLLKQSGRCPGH